MSEVVIALLEVIKYTVPALVVYFLIRQFTQQQYQLKGLELRASQKNDSIAMRIQAYERLTLLSERIGLGPLVLRLSDPEMTSTQLKNALLIAIQQEYEHNLTQQIYTSNELWRMIELLKDNTMKVVSSTHSGNMGLAEYKDKLLALNAEVSGMLGAKVREAIRREVELYFK